MSGWTEGYVSTVDYTTSYFAELNPARVRLAFLMAGLEPPEINLACELGFGQGVSLAVHAAASPVKWHGNDFNPAHVLNASRLCAASGAEAFLSDDSFRDYAGRDDLPKFDLIALHGVWSWISDENRRLIASFIRKNLRIGGVVYVSYNVLAGWSRFLPLREIMMDAQPDDTHRGRPEAVKAAIARLEQLNELNADFMKADATLSASIAQLAKADPRYIAHEYLNRDWKPMSFAEAGQLLGEAKLTYACSATLRDHAASTYLTSEQAAYLDTIPTVTARENLRDIIRNTRFRTDYWVRGGRRLSLSLHTEAVRQLPFVLCESREIAEADIAANIGTSRMTEATYRTLINHLADHKHHCLGAIADALEAEGLSASDIAHMLVMLCHRGHVSLCQDEMAIAAAKPGTDRLNTHLLQAARNRADAHVLASPVIGGGISAGRIDQLNLLAMREGAHEPGEMAAFVWACLSAHGDRLLKDGKELETEAENLDLLKERAATFLSQTLPVLKALAIA